MSSLVSWWQSLNPAPIAFWLGEWPVHFYGLVLATSFLAAYFFTKYRAEKIVFKDWEKVFWVVFGSGAVGARVWDFFFYQNFWEQKWYEIFFVWQGGLAIFGFLLGGFLGLIVFALLSSNPHPASPLKRGRGNFLQLFLLKIKRGNFLQFIRERRISLQSSPFSRGRIKEGIIYNSLQLLAPVFLLAQGIGRWGNFFNQELYGAPTNLPWGIFIAPANRLPSYEFFEYFHPVFLYESLWLFLGLGIFLWLEKKQPPPNLPLENGEGNFSSALPFENGEGNFSSVLPLFKGEDKGGGKFIISQKILLAFFVAWIFTGRVLMELMRLDPTPLWFGLRAPLVYSVLIAIFAIIVLFKGIFKDFPKIT